MNRSCAAIILLLFLMVPACSSNKKVVDTEIPVPQEISETEGPAVASPLVLGEGDEISITVWRQEDLGKTVKIDPSGTIYLPLIGGIRAAGLTVDQLQAELTERLKKYIVAPQVSVNVTELRSRQIYVLGEVNAPGPVVLDQRTTAMEAVARVGGFTKDSDEKNLLLLRPEKDVIRVSSVSLDIKNIDKDPNSYKNVRLRDGDILYVPPTKIVSVRRFMDHLNAILAPIIGLERSIILGADAYDALLGRERATVLAQ